VRLGSKVLNAAGDLSTSFGARRSELKIDVVPAGTSSPPRRSIHRFVRNSIPKGLPSPHAPQNSRAL
jgi:hypothetical protein